MWLLKVGRRFKNSPEKVYLTLIQGSWQKWRKSCTMATESILLSSGHRMPLLGLGTWQAKDEEIENALDAALEAGYRLVDTAFNYNNEEAIGRALKKWIGDGRICREDIFVTTKLPHIGNRASDVEKYLCTSLKRLQLDYVDLYLVHVPFGFLPDETGENPAKNEDGSFVLDTTDLVAVWKVMEEQVGAGRVKSIGISNYNESQIQRILDNCSIPPAVLQVELHGYLQQPELCKFCTNVGIAVTAYSPIGSPGARAHFQQKYNFEYPEFDGPELLQHPVLLEIAKAHERTPAQILLRQLVQQNIAIIPKSANPKRIKENAQIFDFELTDEEMSKLKKLDRGEPGRIINFLFWKGVEIHAEYPFKRQC